MTLPGYKYLKSYQLAIVIYDLTIEFCDRWIDKKSRTHDQMVQAARSGKQNIAEGYLEKSLKMYIKLLGVARGSQGELFADRENRVAFSPQMKRSKRSIFSKRNRGLLVLGASLEDYEDFARQRKIPVWSLEKARDIREIGEIREKSTPESPHIPDLPSAPEQAVNLLITIIHQCNFLLDRQGAALEEKFVREGGYSENLFKKRLEEREKRR